MMAESGDAQIGAGIALAKTDIPFSEGGNGLDRVRPRPQQAVQGPDDERISRPERGTYVGQDRSIGLGAARCLLEDPVPTRGLRRVQSEVEDLPPVEIRARPACIPRSSLTP
jgi:hypothetical protein